MYILEKLKVEHKKYIQENFPTVKFNAARFSKKRWAYISKTKCVLTRFSVITEQDENGDIQSWMQISK